MILDFRLRILRGWCGGGLALVVAFFAVGMLPAGAELRVKDADGVERRLDEPGRVTAVIYSNPEVQQWTRQAGAALDKFQGRADFRIVVVVDLRGTMADWAPGYTVRRMQRDLNAEARRVAPFYARNGNSTDPRPDMSVVPDFKGVVCQALGWKQPAGRRRVVLFGKDGKEAWRSEDLTDLAAWRRAAAEALGR